MGHVYLPQSALAHTLHGGSLATMLEVRARSRRSRESREPDGANEKRRRLFLSTGTVKTAKTLQVIQLGYCCESSTDQEYMLPLLPLVESPPAPPAPPRPPAPPIAEPNCSAMRRILLRERDREERVRVLPTRREGRRTKRRTSDRS